MKQKKDEIVKVVETLNENKEENNKSWQNWSYYWKKHQRYHKK